MTELRMHIAYEVPHPLASQVLGKRLLVKILNDLQAAVDIWIGLGRMG